MNRVSVVVPVLNDEQHLAVLLELLKKQRDKPFEIIIVDNGSTDNSRQLAQAAGVRVISEP
ncbi:glycosyltransferase, partial [Arthrobacter sp. JCM 19049]